MNIFKPLKLLTHLFFITICWVKQNRLLFSSIFIIGGMIVVGIILEKLNYNQVAIFIGAFFTLLWTNKRYWQIQDSIFLNKVDNLYIEVVKLINEPKQTKDGIKYDRRIPNLINAIQASITSHYQGRTEPKNIRATILNFSSMDLSHAYLFKANLNGANLERANLNQSNLQGANLRESNLYNASLQDTNLQGAILIGADLPLANLTNADLQKSYLHDTNLQDACLQDANLRNANLIKADLYYAILDGTNLSDTNLQGAYLEEASYSKETKGIPQKIIEENEMKLVKDY